MKRHIGILSGLGLAMFLAFFVFTGCSSDDAAIVTPPPTPYPADAWLAQKVTTPPADNANVDALWAAVPEFAIPTVVPPYDVDVNGHDIWWNGYEGMQINLTLKAVYTDTHIYILAQWNDPQESLQRQAWYYNGAGPKWLQMGKKYPDEFGNEPRYEDKFSMFWNMTVSNFEQSGCAPLCHGQYMGTNGAGEEMDIWHWKRDRTGPVSQLDDKWLDNATNGRHSDAGTGAYSDNKQQLVTTNNGTVTAPMYWIPGRTNYHWITQAEIDNGTARQIMDMDQNGNWVDEDQNVLDKAQFGYTSALCIPSLKGIKPATGSRGDVSAYHNWSNNMWTLKIKRLRDTGNADDLQFTSVDASYWFSVGVMDAAAIAHAIPGGHAGTSYRMILTR